MKAKSGSALGRENAARLEDYLASIDHLPVRGGRVNVTAVARACGFDRQVLYTNPACRSLLNAAASKKGFPDVEVGQPISKEDESMVPLKKLREAERRVGALEKKVSELRARIVGLETRLRRHDIIETELIARGRRAVSAPLSSAPHEDSK